MQVIILTAGQSSRFWPLNQRHKSLVKIMGKPLIWYTINGLEKAGIKEIIIVQNQKKEIERELTLHRIYSGAGQIKYVIQKKPTGMGDAILEAENLLKDCFFVLNAERIDAGDYINEILNKFKRGKCNSILLASKTKTPWFFGILKVKEDKVLEIIEKPKKGKAPSDLKVIGIYFLPKEFLIYLRKFRGHQYSFEKALSFFAKRESIKFTVSLKEPPSLKFPWHLFEIKNFLMKRYLKSEIANSAKIAKSCQIENKIFISENCKIFENVVIKGPCYIGKNCIIGNNSLIRESTNLENSCLIGANAEVKNCLFQENIHTHSGYFGDSIFGKECRIGAGLITANVRLDRKKVKPLVKKERIDTGFKRLGTIVGENTSFGIHCSLMPGVLIGSNCQIGPNSLVEENIEDNIIFYTKFKGIKKIKK